MAIGSFTLRDFIARLQRSSNDQACALYHENRPLFEGRPDIFADIVLSVPWERGLALAHAARYRQNLEPVVYVALLRRIVRHNALVDRGVVAPPAASWAAAMRVFSEAFGTYGAVLPSSATALALRALRAGATRTSWVAAVGLLRLHQHSKATRLGGDGDEQTRAKAMQIGRGSLLAAAAAVTASCPGKWHIGLKLLARLHAEDSEILPAAVSHLGNVSAGASAPLLQDRPAANGLGPGLLRAAIDTIAMVTAAAPWRVALGNAMCFSYLTHAAAAVCKIDASAGAFNAGVEGAFVRAYDRLPWTWGLRLLEHVDRNLSRNVEQVMMVRPSVVIAGPASPRRSGEGQLKGELVTFPSDAAVARRAEVLAALKLRGMPSTAAATGALCGIYGRASVEDAVARSPVLCRALFGVALREGDAAEALRHLPALNGPLSRADASRLVIRLHADKLAREVCLKVLPFLVAHRCVLTPAALQALLECCVVHNRAVAGEPLLSPAFPVDWRTAVSLVTQLSLPVSRDAPVTTSGVFAIAASSGPAARTAGRQLVLFPAVDHRTLSLLVSLCVEAGHPEAALRVLGASRVAATSTAAKTGRPTIAFSKELEGLLFCLAYGRRREAAMIVKEAERKHGAKAGRPLRSLLQRGFSNASGAAIPTAS
jgi:hypothetical protein